MENALTIVQRPGQSLTTLAEIADKARHYFDAAQSANTRRAYASDMKAFGLWCAGRGLSALPAEPQTVALYLTDHAGKLRNTTLGRHLVSIADAHKLAKLDSPTTHTLVKKVWAGIRREHGTAAQGKTPTLTADLRAMVDGLADSPLEIRDRALLLIGFAGAFRRSELVGLNAGDVAITGDGLAVTLRKSKTDQEGEGQKIGLPYGSNPATCPVRALQAWLALAGIKDGPLFRPLNRHGQIGTARLSDKAVARTVKGRLEAAGIDPTSYAGHSLRSGLATSAAAAGVSERSIMAQTRHKSLPMVRRYIRDGSLFRDNAAAKVGL